MAAFEKDFQLPSEIRSRQLAADQKTLAAQLFEQNIHECRLQQIHPWHAPDAVLLNMARAGIAWSLDRTAEILVQHAEQTTRFRRRPYMPYDAARFALGLCETAAQKINEVESPADNSEPVFTDDVFVSLAAENQLPWWPSVADTQVLEWQQADAGDLSGPFLHGIHAAAGEIMGHAWHNVHGMYGDEVVVPVPEQYEPMEEFIRDNLLADAQRHLDFAQAHLPADRSLPEGSPSLLTDVYGHIHDGYIGAMTAYLAVTCPPSLGPAMLPQR